ncbi:hypothetical protein SAMN04488564_10720 [Lentzea waywayandensis]|uniref:PH domain-containing protein n=1 Tax=Lentzea waywayandensis TaxID=84724 RepID=A0A1I6F0R0_9PSEU|nr:PH domain-containing protein [Lentzea waywayandensis]SFR23528.1 hypothetical protein SAMN04488564_10720 [Lentzea waywayandensis]
MGVDLLPEEHVLWQGEPAKHSVFLRPDLTWIRFSLKFHAVLILLVVVVAAAAHGWADYLGSWSDVFGVCTGFAVLGLLGIAEPFVWRYQTLRRTTYYVTDQRVVSVPGRRARSAPLTEIGYLAFTEEPGGSGHIRLDSRVMPDGYGNGTVAELIHVPDVHEVVTLISTLTGQPANRR